jgi:hypothetical protein
MALSNERKILIFLAIIIVVGYFLYNNRQKSVKSAEHLEGDVSNSNNDSDNSSMDSTESSASTTSQESASQESSASTASTASSVSGNTESVDRAAIRVAATTSIKRGKNANMEGTPKQVSYKDGKRGGPGELDKFFIQGNAENASENAEFSPADYVSDKLAAYAQKKTDEGLLPVEEKDWFEDVTPTKIKNRHLINIYRPVGVNTISTSLKNPSLDIRGAPANPKTVISPFLNSSIEPDHNIRGLCV